MIKNITFHWNDLIFCIYCKEYGMFSYSETCAKSQLMPKDYFGLTHFVFYIHTVIFRHIISACEDGQYGIDCEYNCTCENGAICDPVTGECTCGMGWQGDSCDIPCPEDKFGPNCMHTCSCQNGASCDSVTGCCDCPSGWYGQQCGMSKLLYFFI